MFDFNNYQTNACETFKEHVELTPYQARLANWALGLGGESGEVQELLKHHLFYGAEMDKMELAKELGDVLWYLAAIATTLGINLEDIAELNCSKLQHRYNMGGFDPSRSAERHEREILFKETPLYKVIKARILRQSAPMNVIFVGPDGSGKTTIAKKVAEELGFTYHKCDYRQDNKPELALQLLYENTNVVYDRFYWPDDPLYCAVKNIEMDDTYWQKYDAVIHMMERTNTLIIYVFADLETLKQRSNQWADDYVDIAQLESIIQHYQGWLQYVDAKRISTCASIDTTGIEVGSDDFNRLVYGCVQAVNAGQKIYGNVEDK